MEIRTYDQFWFNVVGRQAAQKTLILGANTIVWLVEEVRNER